MLFAESTANFNKLGKMYHRREMSVRRMLVISRTIP